MKIRVYATFQLTIVRDVEAIDNDEAIIKASREIDKLSDADLLEEAGELSLDDYETETLAEGGPEAKAIDAIGAQGA